MSYTECEECGKRLWWDEVDFYEEVDGKIICTECLADCEICDKVFIHEGGDHICDDCMTSLQEKE